MGKPIVMGRATFDSIGRALPGRTNIVLTRRPDWAAEGVLVATSPDEALALAAVASPGSDICVIGGAQVYDLFMPRAGRLEITMVNAHPEGDAHFPAWDRSEWVLTHEDFRQGDPSYSFQTWRRASTEGDSQH